MKICVLVSSYADSTSPIKDYDDTYEPASYLNGYYHFDTFYLKKATALEQIEQLVRRDYDIFFNLCDGELDEDDVPGVEVVEALEKHGVPFTGCNSDLYRISRQSIKAACLEAGVKVPAGIFLTDPDDLKKKADSFKFPMIVKHPNSYSSIGLTPASRVENLEQLHDQAARMIADYGSALAEEFIEGREFTVLVVENPDDPSSPITYHPLECLFPEGETFKHFELKWLDCEDMKFIPCQDSELAERLKAITKKAFIAVKGNGYARCDIRMDGQGKLYLLDLNSTCAIYYPPGIATADKILSNHPDGHRGFTEIIFRLAKRRKWHTADEYYAINA